MKFEKTISLENIKTEYIKLKEDFANKKSGKQLLTFAEARKTKRKIDWKNFNRFQNLPLPGVKVFEAYDLNEIAKYIDWQPFFIAWEMHGKFPQILSDKIIGKKQPNYTMMHRPY